NIGTVTISKADLDTKPIINNINYTYTGAGFDANRVNINLNGADVNIFKSPTYQYFRFSDSQHQNALTADEVKNVGAYTLVATFHGAGADNYNTEVEAQILINPAPLSLSSLEDQSVSYSSAGTKIQTPTVNGVVDDPAPEGLYT